MELPSIEFLDDLRGLIDFGLFILIWLVQLIIYPSFEFTDSNHFQKWHYRYTGLITIFVLPLMFSQTGLYCWECYAAGRWHDQVGLVLIGFTWLSTFMLSVPCHDRLQKSGHDSRVIRRLVRTNWFRTAAWSLMVGIDLVARIIP